MLRKGENMDTKELIIITAKEILLAYVSKGMVANLEKSGEDFKTLVSKVKEAVDSLEKKP
jgi:hypothetical protein